ncbi:MAG TPA: hypothetical protein VKR59_02635 [Terriglobales bacterium]|nr:hypothetical protein [Terriglobales bacterium]
MKSKQLQIATFCLVALATLCLSRTAKADTWNKSTKLTFSQPVEVSGIVLQSGTYWFQLMDSPADRNIVQIWNADHTKLIRTILAIPSYRMNPTGETVVRFDERPTGTPEAIKTWYYPGTNFGQEFVYRKARPTQLAENASEPILSVRDEAVATPASVLKQTPAAPSDDVEVAEIVDTVAIAEALPETATTLPLLGLIGLLAVAAGLSLRFLTINEAV